MEPQDKQALLEAVNILIQSPDAHELFEALDVVAPLAARAPVKLADGAAPLNPLLRLRLRNPPAYERVMAMIETKRAALGYEPLVKPVPEPGYDKVAYMRAFMDQKRVRQRIAAEIENTRRPERSKLVGNARLEFMRRQSERWLELRDLAVEQARAQAGGALKAERRAQVLDEFWKAVDADLEARMEQAKREALSPKRTTPPDDDMASLIEALKLPAR